MNFLLYILFSTSNFKKKQSIWYVCCIVCIMYMFVCVCIQTTVRSVRQQPDFSHSGQWEVVTQNKGGQEERHIFDGVLVCSGHYTQPITPMDAFKGMVFQSTLYSKCVPRILSDSEFLFKGAVCVQSIMQSSLRWQKFFFWPSKVKSMLYDICTAGVSVEYATVLHLK